MKHFIILIEYKAPLEEIVKLTEAHRAHLQKGYKKGMLLLSGPQVPRTGGVVIGRCSNKEELETFFAEDPYSINSCADYRYIEFAPKSHQNFLSEWISE